MIGFSLGPVGRAVRRIGAVIPPAAPWAFVGAGAVTTITSGNQLVLPLHSAAQAGDFIVVQLSSNSSLNAPTGTAINVNTPYARFLQATPGQTSVSFTLTLSNTTATGIAVLFRPVSAAAFVVSGSNAAAPATVSSLAVANLPGLITIGGNHGTSVSTAWTPTLPSGFVEVASVPSNAGGTVRGLYFAYKIQETGSTTGNMTLAVTGVSLRATAGVFRLT